MSPIRNLKDMQFGRLMVICLHGRTKYGHVVWLVRCDCGNLTYVLSHSLLSGNTSSCGCLQKEKVAETGKANYKHGEGKTRLYKIWEDMIARCHNPNRQSYRYYGGRGIKVCDEWRTDYLTFKRWSLAHGYSDSLTIDRVDNDGNYELNNCQFLTKSDNTKKAQSECWRRKNAPARPSL